MKLDQIQLQRFRSNFTLMESTRYKSIKGFIFSAHLFLWSGNKRIETDVVSAGKLALSVLVREYKEI